VGGGNEAEGQDFTHGQGTDFDGVGTSQMVVIRESLRESSVWRVGYDYIIIMIIVFLYLDINMG
jgi:hypothetical protein